MWVLCPGKEHPSHPQTHQYLPKGSHLQKVTRCRLLWSQGCNQRSQLPPVLDSMVPIQVGISRRLLSACPHNMLLDALLRCRTTDCLWSFPIRLLVHPCVRFDKQNIITDYIQKGDLWISFRTWLSILIRKVTSHNSHPQGHFPHHKTILWNKRRWIEEFSRELSVTASSVVEHKEEQWLNPLSSKHDSSVQMSAPV